MKLNNNCGSLQTDTSFLSKCAISPSRLQKVENANKLGAWETLSQTEKISRQTKPTIITVTTFERLNGLTFLVKLFGKCKSVLKNGEEFPWNCKNSRISSLNMLTAFLLTGIKYLEKYKFLQNWKKYFAIFGKR